MRLSPRHIAPYAAIAAGVAWILALQGPPSLPPLAREAIAPGPALRPALPVIHDFPVTLSLCPRLGIANAPPGDRSLHIIGYTARARVNAVTLARAPVERACVSSGFGNRNGQAHTGIDLYNRDPVAIYAAGDGVIREAHYRDDYGNMLVIDHGRGVFTRYAHLASPTDFSEGDTVTSGQIIGVMGNTASHLIPRHLHYEILTGTWGHQAGSFALKPVNPLKPEDEIE